MWKRIGKVLLAMVLLGETLYIAPNGRQYYINESPGGPRYVHPLNNNSRLQEPDVLIERGGGIVYPQKIQNNRHMSDDYPLFQPSEDGEGDD